MESIYYSNWTVSPDVSIVLNANGTFANVYERRRRKLWFLNNDAFSLVELYNQNITLKNIFEVLPQGEKSDRFIESAVEITKSLISKEILISSNGAKKGVLRQEKLSPALTSIQFEVTRRCNLRCKHCYLNDYSGENELTTEEVFNLIDNASELGVHEIHITGGEPLVRKDIKQIISRIYEKGMYGKLYTNGILIDDDFVGFLNHVGIEAVKISLDGFKPKTHNDFRRAKNGFEKTIENIYKLSDAGIPVEVGSVITRGNVSETNQLINFFKNELRVKYHIDSFVPIGQGIHSAKDIVLSDEEYIEALKTEFTETIKSTDNNVESKKEFFCGAGNSYVFINANGLVKFCPTMPDSLNGGNIRVESLDNIWIKSPFFNNVRNINCKFYDDCPHASQCRGGCRSRSLLKYGAIEEADIQMCKMFFATTGIKSPGLIEWEKANAQVQY